MDALQKLGIDGWSLVLYLVNYGILFFVLGKYVYKPLAKAMDARSEKIRNVISKPRWTVAPRSLTICSSICSLRW